MPFLEGTAFLDNLIQHFLDYASANALALARKTRFKTFPEGVKGNSSTK